MGDVSDISSLLAMHKPRIVVDEGGGKLLLSLPCGGSCLIFLSGGDCLWRGRTLNPVHHDVFATKRVSY